MGEKHNERSPEARHADGSRRLDGRVIVVTGAARGQGAAECALLTAHGADVIGADQDTEWAAQDPQAERLRWAMDVGDPAAWSDLAAELQRRFGTVFGLINNAGITSRVRIGEVTLEDWDRVLRVNVTSAMLAIQALVPLMSSGGSIVNVGSVAALTGHYTAAYTTSKFALRGLTQVVATEYGPRGIRANAVHPGYTVTPMTASAPPGFAEANLAMTPLGRAGQPQDVAHAMLFLMSDGASFITGADIPVDGGFSAGAVSKTISDALSLQR